MRLFVIAAFFGVIEGITEWLPVSSTGHIILFERFVGFPVRQEFFELFEVFIQLGALACVALLFRGKLFSVKGAAARRATLSLWGKVLLAALPAAVIGFLFDDFIDRVLFRPLVVALALIFYGVLFLFFGRKQGGDEDISSKTALGVGAFQVLALVPGTSRSGATILGGTVLGLSRPTAAEFSFFLGLPTMCGAGALKAFKFWRAGGVLSPTEWQLLLIGAVVSFLVSLCTIRFFTEFVRRHSFVPFGVYRILLGAAVLIVAFCGSF